MKVVTIAVTSLRRAMRERMSGFAIFVLPLLLILLLGLLYGNPSYRVGLVADDGRLARELTAGLMAADGIEVTEYPDQEALVDAVAHHDEDAGLILPPAYDDSLRRGDDVVIEYLATSDLALFEVSQVVESEVTGQASRIAAARLAGSVAGSSFDEGIAASAEAAAALSAVEVEVVGVGGGELKEVGAFDLQAYRMLVLFVFLGALAGAAHVIESRNLGMARRMLATPTAPRTIITGETAGRFLIAFVQSLVIVVVAAVVFGVRWGDWAATVAIVVAFAATSAGAGMLLGSIFGRAQLAESVGVFVALAFAMVGGSMGASSLPVPHAFANGAFDEVVVNGAGLTTILPELGVLAMYTAVFLAAAAFLFRRTITGSHA